MQNNEVAVSIIMPCLNEVGTVGTCVATAQETLELVVGRYDLAGEVIVVDNGSTDGSQDIAAAAGARVVHAPEPGYGAALSVGFNAARGRFFIMGDCDCSYDFTESVPMIGKLLDGADMCIGSRFRGEIKPGAMPWKNRYIGNPVLSLVLRVLFNTRVDDAHCGLRVLTKECFGQLRLTSVGMEFASEMVLKASLLKMKIAETPVTLFPDKRGRPPHLRPLRDGWRHLRYMLMLSPTWLFFAPAAFLSILASMLFAVLLWQPDLTMVSLGPLAVGDHWMIAASSMILVSVQAAFFGLATLIYGFNEGYRRPTRFGQRLMALSRLEYWLIAGLALILLGGFWVFSIASEWAGSGFGPLNATRGLTAAFTALVVGFQVFLGGFLLSILSGNRARLDMKEPDLRADVASEGRGA